MFTALASLLTNETVQSDTAMTGEISLRGLVLPVGGIKERKVAGAASRAAAIVQPSMIATARVQPADARSILTGKHDTMKPVGGNCSRLCSFSMWQ